MLVTVRSRALAVLGLLGLLIGLVVWYGTLGPAPALGAYPHQADLARDYDRYLGDRASVSGRVVDTTPVTIAAEYRTGEALRLTVTGLDRTLSEGEQLNAHGIVRPDRTIRATRAFTVPSSGLWYAYGVSLLAGLWVLSRLVRYWRVDPADWTLTPRETPLPPPLVDRVRTALRGTDDA